MKIHNNELTVYRNETWTLSKKVINRDGSPYIISSELNNPYFLVTVASGRYEQTDRYIYNKWLNLKNFERFLFTQPVDISNVPIFDETTLEIVDYAHYRSFNDMPLPAGYQGDKSLGYANIAIFAEKVSPSVTHYKFWEYINNIEDDYSGRWVDYDCPIVTTFSKEVTSAWIEQNYYYSILLVDGVSTLEYLLETAQRFNIDTTGLDINQLYNVIKELDSSLVENVKDLNKPLIDTTGVHVILPPTKLSVQSVLEGVI